VIRKRSAHARRPATIKDVAAHAHCSPATISRALNNHPRVTDATRARVLRSAHALDYHPDGVAKSLRVRRTFSLGLVVRDVGNPNFSVLCAAVATTAAAHGYTEFMCSSAWDVDAEREIFRAMIQRRFDGVALLMADETHSNVGMLVDVGIPIVLLESHWRRAGTAVDSVLSDNLGGARAAAEYLLGLGHERIGVLAGSQTVAPGRDRLRGLLDDCARAGAPVPRARVAVGAFSEEHGYRGTLALMKAAEAPTALFCSNNQLLQGALMALRECGARIPDDVSIVSFDESTAAVVHDPRITVVTRDVSAIGARAAELLSRRIARPRSSPACTVLVPTRLEIRGSCRRPA
jgi:LacI family transcriptional regulator